MGRYRNALVRELGDQLVRGPHRLKWKQTLGAERLFRIVQADQDYPYEILTDYVARYRSRAHGVQRPLMPGRELLHDLPVLIDEVSGSAPLAAAEAPGELFTVEDLAQRFGVSTKTINRWRTDGLIGRKVQFDDGKIRVAFLADSINAFAASRGERIRRGSQFSRLSPEERDDVLRRARRMARHGPRQQVIERIAKRLGRSIETIRYVVAAWDQEHPTRALFPDRRRAFSPEQFQQIFDAHQAGQTVQQLARRLGRSPSTIYRAICEMRFEELRKRRPQYVQNAEFHAIGVEEQILRQPIPDARPGPQASPPPDALPYLRDLWGSEVLTAEQERALFRRYNFLKFLAGRDIERMEATGLLSGRRLDRTERWLAWAESVRERLIRANLRLVVSIAKKHHGPMTLLADLISDGNMVLIRAIEKFDYARGQKFSTYCSWAVMKHYARSIPEGNYERRWLGAIEPEQWRQVAGDVRLVDYRKPHLDAIRANLEEGLAVLPQRERDVLVEHYGLDGAGKGKTLSQIGRQLGVTKERVRQIESAALGRLKKMLGPELLEQLQ